MSDRSQFKSFPFVRPADFNFRTFKYNMIEKELESAERIFYILFHTKLIANGHNSYFTFST